MNLNDRDNEPKHFNQGVRGWIVVLCSALFYLYQFTIRVSPNIMNDELMSRFAIDATSLGGMISVYYWAYAGMQLPLGITMDRFGPKIFIVCATFLCAIACYLFGHTTDLLIASIARFMMGMGSACGLIGTLKLGTVWIHSRHLAKVTAMTILFGAFGAWFGGTPLKLLLAKYGFTNVMTMLSYLGLFVSVIVIFGISNKPLASQNNSTKSQHDNPIDNIIKIIKNKQTWVLALYGMLMYLPITLMGVAWGVSLIERICNTSEEKAAFVVSFLFAGAALGSPIFAIISDKFKSRKKPMIIGSMAAVILWSTVIFIPNIPLHIMCVLFFFSGVFYTAKCLTFASICEIMPLNISGLSVACVNMVVMTTGIIFNPLIGYLIDSHWNGKRIDNIPLYTVADYSFALTTVPIALAISCFILFFMKETHPDNNTKKGYGSIVDTDVL